MKHAIDPIDAWADPNGAALQLALHDLHERLEGLARLGLHAGPQALATLPRVVEARQAARQVPDGALSALHFVAEAFALAPFECDVLFLAVARELDPDLGFRCGRALGTDRSVAPTFALALALFESSTWDALAPSRPLRFWGLIEAHPVRGEPLIHAPLTADERIVHFLKGLDDLDATLLPFLLPLEVDSALVAPSQDALARKAVQVLARGAPYPLIECLGPDAVHKKLIAARIAESLHTRLYRLDVRQLPATAEGLDALIRRWNRDATLLNIGLYMEVEDTATDHRLGRMLEEVRGLVVLATSSSRMDSERPVLRLDVNAPTVTERISAWQKVLGPDAGTTPEALALQFALDLPAITALAATTPESGTASDPSRHPRHHALWDACRLATRPRLDTLAQRIEPRASWEDLVLPEGQMDLLLRIVNTATHRGRVLGDWGFGARHGRGLGLSVLFAGESGTGKTMAAEVMAATLCLDLYRIDLSTVVSKYIGETEKNLRRLFDTAEGGGTLLFFDEADALFGKRSEVKDSHDRYANIEVNYLLQRIETFRGLAVLATNRRNALDDAFLRRLTHVVVFPFPGREERRSLWARAFPEDTPVHELDTDWLARFSLSGGVIHTIALNAAFAAAAADQPVTMPLVLEAIRIELEKREQPVSESLLRGPAANGHASTTPSKTP